MISFIEDNILPNSLFFSILFYALFNRPVFSLIPYTFIYHFYRIIGVNY